MKKRALLAAIEALGIGPDDEVVLQDDSTTHDDFEIVRATHEYPEGDVTDMPQHADPEERLNELPRPILVLRTTLRGSPRRAVTQF